MLKQSQLLEILLLLLQEIGKHTSYFKLMMEIDGRFNGLNLLT